MVTADLVRQVDYIFCMTQGHVESITLLYPQAAEKTFLLREFNDELHNFEKDISDPIGGSFDIYVRCRRQIEQGISSMLKFLDQTYAPALMDRPAIRPLQLAIGSDHGGFELKEQLKAYLHDKGIAVTDLGTHCHRVHRLPRLRPTGRPWRGRAPV